MRAVAITNTDPTIATTLAEHAVERFGKRYLANPEFCRCLAIPLGHMVQRDHCDTHIAIEYPDNSMISITGINCLGTTEQIRINIATGRIRYYFNGRRQSGGGSICGLLHHTTWKQIKDVSNWRLVHLDTMWPDLAVCLPLLRGCFKPS